MNLAIVLKTLRDSRLLLLLVLGGILIFELLFLRALQNITAEFANAWLQLPIAQRVVRMLLGADLLGDLRPTTFTTLGFAHPVPYTLMWIFLLTTGTRVIVGEIDRGTADLLLSLPVSRTALYASVTVVGVLAALPLSAAPWVGVWLGERLSPLNEPINLARLAILPVNLFAINLAIGGVTLMLASFTSRRGTALAIAIAWLLGSFLLNFLAQFWSTAERFEFIGVLHYYRPLPIVRSGQWPARDLATLVAIGVVAWGVGLWHFRRRDIPAI